jgi:hypothetical protein
MLFWLSATGMPLSVVRVGRLAMKSFLCASDRDSRNTAACGDVADSQRRLLIDQRSREPGCEQKCRGPPRDNFGGFAVIAPVLLQSAEAEVPCCITVL